MADPTNAALALRQVALEDQMSAWLDQEYAFAFGTVNGGPNGDGTFPFTNLKTGETVLRKCAAQVQYEASTPKMLKKTGLGPFTMLASEINIVWLIGNGTAPANISVRLPDAPFGSQYMFIQYGSGRLIFSAVAGTIVNRQGFTRSAGKSALTLAICTAVDANGHSEWTLGGDMSLTNT